MIDFNEELSKQNDYGVYFFHYNNHPLLWIKEGAKIKYVILPMLDDFFSRKYMRFLDMSRNEFEYIFRDDIIVINDPVDCTDDPGR